MIGRQVRLALAALLALSGAVPAAAADKAPAAHHEERRARPGDVVSAEPFAPQLLPLVPMAARGWRILYTSRTATGTPIEVSGSVLIPRQKWAGPGPRPLLGFAVGTQGLADRCAPSNQLAAGTEYEAPNIAQAIQRGWAVAITDYPGLGTPGDHTYAVAKANGRAVLDAMRAARRLPGTGLDPRGPAAIYGFSEGGGAAGGAIEQQPRYAPDVPLRGAFVGAAPADFKAMLTHVDGSAIAFLLGYAAVGFQAAYRDFDLNRYATPKGRRAIAALRQTCLFDAVALGLTLPKNREAYFTVDPFEIKSLRRRLRENDLGFTAPRTPVLLGAPRNDEIVPYAIMADLYRRYCDLGVNATLKTLPLADHILGDSLIAPYGMKFLADRFAGKPLPRAKGC